MSTRQKVIVMLSGDYMPETFGGAQQQCGKVAEELVKTGHRVCVYTNRTKVKTLPREITRGVEVIRPYTMFSPQLLGKYSLFGVYWLLRWLAWVFFHRKDIKLIHVHQAKFQAFLGCVAGKLINVPVIVKLGNSGEHNDITRLQAKELWGYYLSQYVINNTTTFIAISTQIFNELTALGVPTERIHLTFNGVNQSISRDVLTNAKLLAKQKMGISSHARVVVFAGRFEQVKNLDTLLRAFRSRIEASGNSNLILLMVGEGNDLAEKYHSERLSGSIRFVGRVENVMPFLLASDFVVSPSFAEGMSNSVLEAMAVGCIPLTTPVSGAVDLVESGVNGQISSGFDLSAILTLLDWANDVPEQDLLEKSLKNFDKIRTQFRIEVIAARIDNLYSKLLAD